MATVHLNAIRLNGIIGADRKLTVQLPLDVPDGPVELVVLLPEKAESPAEADRTEGSSARELLELGKLPPNARPSHELINEDREDRF